MAGTTVVRQPGEGSAYWMLGGLYEVKVSSDESAGALTLMEMTMPAGMGPPSHIHSCDETVCVLEGRIRYHIGGEATEAGPGACFHVPEGTEENFEPLEQSRVLVLYTPGGMDRFFAEAAQPAERREIPPPPSEPPDVERLAAIGKKHGLEITARPAAV